MHALCSSQRFPCREPNILSTSFQRCKQVACISGVEFLSCSQAPAPAAKGRVRSRCGTVLNCVVSTAEKQPATRGRELGYRTDLAEQYSLLEVIGKGNFGVVWLAASRHDPSQHVAVKVIPKTRKGNTSSDSIECIQREVALWNRLSGDSPFVARLLGLYEDASSVYLVQHLCAGGDLAGALQHGPLPEACCAAIMWCVLSAIRDCHTHRLALLDVKPQNFLITAPLPIPVEPVGEGSGWCPVAHLRLEDQLAVGTAGGPSPCVVACDFGCSLTYNELARGAKRGGSPVFFAPEQFTSSYGLEVDVWAAGVMLYLLLTGRYPFWEAKREDMESKLPAYQVMLAVCSAPINFSGPEWRRVSRDARDLVSSMLDRNPGTRLTAAQALQHPWFQRWQRSGSGAPHGATNQNQHSHAHHNHHHNHYHHQQHHQQRHVHHHHHHHGASSSSTTHHQGHPGSHGEQQQHQHHHHQHSQPPHSQTAHHNHNDKNSEHMKHGALSVKVPGADAAPAVAAATGHPGVAAVAAAAGVPLGVAPSVSVLPQPLTDCCCGTSACLELGSNIVPLSAAGAAVNSSGVGGNGAAASDVAVPAGEGEASVSACAIAQWH